MKADIDTSLRSRDNQRIHSRGRIGQYFLLRYRQVGLWKGIHMTAQQNYSIEERLIQLLRHLGIERAHFAASLPRDWEGLVDIHPDLIASLTLTCPMGINLSALRAGAPPMLVFAGDQGRPAGETQRAVASLPGATLIMLPNYFSPPWADPIADRTDEIRAVMLDFLARVDKERAAKAVTLSPVEGEIAEISYSIRGSGSPLVLLPLALAPSQWEPLLPALSACHCTITLGGSALGMVAHLEARAHSGYLRLVRHLVDEAGLRRGQALLEVGCGSGALVRWLARQTGPQTASSGSTSIAIFSAKQRLWPERRASRAR